MQPSRVLLALAIGLIGSIGWPPASSQVANAQAASPPGWVAAAPPNNSHWVDGRLIQLGDGRVLLVGGTGTPEVYDPDLDQWTDVPIAGDPEILRPSLVTLADGRVLVVKGRDVSGLGDLIFDPVLDTWTAVVGAQGSTAILLRDGRVAIWGWLRDACEKGMTLYDPVTDQADLFDTAYGVCGESPTMVQVPDGRVLVTGACSSDGPATPPTTGPSTQAYFDLVSHELTWGPNPARGPATCNTGTVLPNGDELFTGGQSWPYVGGMQTHKTFDDVTRIDVIRDIPITMRTMPVPRTGHRALLTPDGRVVIVGGTSPYFVQKTYLYNPSSDSYVSLPDHPPGYVTDAVLLDSGDVLTVNTGREANRLSLGLIKPEVVAGSTYHPITPVRLLDSRSSIGTGTFTSGVPRSVQIGGRPGVPSGVTAITANLTVVGQTAAGFVAVTPVSTASPTTSTINFPVKDTRANGLTVPVGPTGKVWLVYKASSTTAKTDLLLDVTGYFTGDATGSTYHPITPVRLLDSRSKYGYPSGFAHASPGTFQVGATVVPLDAVAVTGNVTVTSQTRAGYVALTESPDSTPPTSTLNFPLGDTRANNTTLRLGPLGRLSAVYLAAAGKSAHILFDVAGYWR
jgi:hypothetical protein